jgi:seryl-tRNA synthetase
LRQGRDEARREIEYRKAIEAELHADLERVTQERNEAQRDLAGAVALERKWKTQTAEAYGRSWGEESRRLRAERDALQATLDGLRAKVRAMDVGITPGGDSPADTRAKIRAALDTDPTQTEKERRALAQTHKDDFDVESAVPVAPKRLGQMVSVRLDPDVAIAMRDLAIERGTSMSDLLREGAAVVLADGDLCPPLAATPDPTQETKP